MMLITQDETLQHGFYIVINAKQWEHKNQSKKSNTNTCVHILYCSMPGRNHHLEVLNSRARTDRLRWFLCGRRVQVCKIHQNSSKFIKIHRHASCIDFLENSKNIDRLTAVIVGTPSNILQQLA